MKISPSICVPCKGAKYLCGYKPCPLLAGFYQKRKVEEVKEVFFGKSNSIFVGREGYPNVFVGPTSPLGENPTNPAEWFNLDYSKIVEASALILRSKFKESIKSGSRFVEDSRLLSMASKPADIEMSFSKKPVFDFKFSPLLSPMGPSAQLKKLRITENVKVERRVEYIISDSLKSSEQAVKLFESKQDVYKIIDVLSSGSLGVEKKMVPTRWSITAVDDILGSSLIEEVKNYPSLNEYLVFSSRFLSNHFEILLMPGNWEFENFEAWAPGSSWNQWSRDVQVVGEYEPYSGRTSYADKQAGGYYAARLGILEGLRRMRRQARVVSFREINEGYVIPVGVWQVRENVRNAMRGEPEKFCSLSDALKHVSSKLRVPFSEYKKRSKIFGQKRLGEF